MTSASKVPSEERLRLGEAASGMGTFVLDLGSGEWDWSTQVATLFGVEPAEGGRTFAAWERFIFPDDVPKIHAAFEAARESGNYYVEFRIKHHDGSLHWLASKGQPKALDGASAPLLHGAIYEITQRKALEARLLAANETLEARVTELREEARTLEVLNETGVAVAAELDLERLVQLVTDASVELSHAEFGAFFYNVVNDTGEAYTLYTLSGAPRSAFARFPMPRNTAIFEPTFRGRGPVRSDDILKDARYGKSGPHHGMPEGQSAGAQLSGCSSCLPLRGSLGWPLLWSSATARVYGAR